jgi:RNA polymerase sigma-70 factor, ECF subfamily
MVGAHLEAVWHTLRRLGVPDDSADDAAQQVFLVASQKLDQIQVGRERPYLLGIALKVASIARRTAQRRREVLMDDLDAGALPPREQELLPDEALDEKRGLARLETVLARMPAEMREAFVLFELEELSAPEVAEVLAIPVGTVASRVRRARDHIRAQLSQPKGGEP